MKTTSLVRSSDSSPQFAAAFVRHGVSRNHKSRHWLATALAAVLVAAAPCQAQPPTGLSAPPAGDAAAKSIPFDQLGAQAQKQYTGDGVAITPTDGGARLRAAFQDLAAEATPDGLWLESTTDENAGKATRFRVRAVTIRREGGASINLTKHGLVRSNRETALYLRAGLVEEYSVSMDGVRQDFILPQRPAGNGELRIELAVDGARAEAATDGAKLSLDGSGRVIAYSRLHVADANGRELTAKLEVTDPNHIEVRVDDSSANYPIRIDPTFSDADWTDFGRLPGPSDEVRAVVADGSGNLYIAGAFTTIGEIPVNYIAQWNGSAWSALGSGVDNQVHALAVSGTDLYVAGEFTTAGGAVANRIAKWDGSAWSALGSGMSNTVRALAISGSDLYAGGHFTTAGGNSARYVAKWNGGGWSSLGSGMNNTVQALVISGAYLYAGGDFTTADGENANYIARWSGGAWGTLGSGMDYAVSALAVSGTDLYAGGSFTRAGSARPNFIAKWNGSAWSTLGTGMNKPVNSLVISGTNLYAGGLFTTAGGDSAMYVAKWNGNAWSALGSGMNDKVSALAVFGSDLYAAGSFATAGGDGASRIARWNGSAWSALGWGVNNEIHALAVSGTDLYAGGSFSFAGGVAANRIAKWNGSTWSALGTGMEGSSMVAVYVLAVSGNDLYAGGLFTTAGGSSANNITKWNRSAWSALGSGMNGSVFALAVSGSDLYAGGNFGTAGGKQSAYIARGNIPPDPEIEVEQPAGVPLVDGGGNATWGPTPVDYSGPAKTFLVRSSGNVALNLSSPTPLGGNAGDFIVDTTGMATTVILGTSTTFAVIFTPTGPGTRSTTLQIFSNDEDENPFDVTLTGTGLSFTDDFDGDGLGDGAEFQWAALGFDWQVSQPGLVNSFMADANRAGLFTTSQVQALHLDTPLIQRNGVGIFTLTLGLQKSTTLLPGSFLPFPFTEGATLINGAGKIEFQFCTEDNAAFFRVEGR